MREREKERDREREQKNRVREREQKNRVREKKRGERYEKWNMIVALVCDFYNSKFFFIIISVAQERAQSFGDQK